MKIIIAGGTGQIGQHLVAHLDAAGHEAWTLSRRAADPEARRLQWDAATLGAWAEHVDGADAVINLAGRSVDCRYNARNRAAIYASRLDSTRALGEAIAAASRPPAVWLNASTATIYRHALDAPQDAVTGEIWRGDEPGIPEKWHFSVDVARRWEAALAAAPTPHTRKVAMRAAMVMDPAPGGVFAVLSRLVRLGLGGHQGDGRQYVSWIHVDDLLAAIDRLLVDEALAGPINLAAPRPLPNRDFMRALRVAWRVTLGLPATRWMLELGAVALRTETELVLKSRRAVPTRLLEGGFAFRFPSWPEAALDLVARAQARRARRALNP